jgi:hypothetical protein
MHPRAALVLVQKQLCSLAVIVYLIPIPKCEAIDGQVPRLARPGELRYNNPMVKRRRYLGVWLSLVLLVLILIAAAALWLRGAQLGGGRSPLATPAVADASPLSTPAAESEMSPPPASWNNGGVVLLWVALGVLLALIIAFAILRWYRHPT